ncbi:MAG: prepilin-type N-terminal cleavage/methylation domain-containing protein [Candidatus Omnitrophica bacterium]|nr:prepilin-type N-terminal cleavage/methylation domain-containing protein [Candidatus Omnitrophota bacterium]
MRRSSRLVLFGGRDSSLSCAEKGISAQGVFARVLCSSRSAFTLVELLVVIAIILVLVSIALPNFLNAVTRANITKAYGEMRSLGTALAGYNTDHQAFPQAAGFFPLERLKPLTTPVAYIEEIPRDPFSGNFIRTPYWYGAMDLDVATRWLLASQGPDRNRSSDPIEFYPGYSPDLFIGLVPEFNYMVYSPTNGIVSQGDLFHASDWSGGTGG